MNFRDQPLLEFRAGCCIKEGNTLKPDLRKGLIYIKEEDGLLHIYWKELNSSEPEVDLIVCQDDGTKFEKVENCTTGRVYVLCFISGDKHYFWMQLLDESKDEEHAKKFNDLLQNSQEMDIEEEDNLDANDSQEQELLRILQETGGLGNEFLSSAAGLGQSAEQDARHWPANNESSNNVRPQRMLNEEDLELKDVLSPEALMPLLNDPEIGAKLFEYLPEGSEHSLDEVKQTVQSPQFKQALNSLSLAIRSGQIAPLLRQLGLDPSSVNDVASFLEAIENQARRK